MNRSKYTRYAELQNQYALLLGINQELIEVLYKARTILLLINYTPSPLVTRTLKEIDQVIIKTPKTEA